MHYGKLIHLNKVLYYGRLIHLNTVCVLWQTDKPQYSLCIMAD